MDMNTLMLVMMMQGGRSNNMLPLLLMMSMQGGQGNALSTLGIDSKALQVAMLPGVGSVGKMLLGGVGAVVAGKMLGGNTRRRRNYRPRTIYVNNNRRYYGRRRY